MRYKVGDVVFSTIWNKSVLIKDIRPNRFYLIADLEYLSRTMITYESNLKYREDDIEKDMEEYQKLCDEIMAIQGIEPIEAEMEQIIHCPTGYIFKDENGNVINATKIVLEKKKPKYPRTYEECCEVLGIEGGRLMFNNSGITQYERNLYLKINNFSKLLMCRDAYWKLAGDWKPEFGGEPYYCILVANYKVETKAGFNGLTNCTRNTILAFPTEEMRDAFYENFKVLIEECKELL